MLISAKTHSVFDEAIHQTLDSMNSDDKLPFSADALDCCILLLSLLEVKRGVIGGSYEKSYILEYDFIGRGR
jgi:hypothetical protein